jgi:hypothetical protein
MKRLLAIAALLAVSALTVTFGAGTTANVSWTPPTQYMDGSALPATDIDHYTIAWAPVAGQSGPSGSQTVLASASQPAVVPVACGQVTFTITATTGAAAKYPNATSGASNAVPYVTGVTCAPNPPSGLAVH